MVCDNYTESMTKGIIVANSRSGITIQKIADVFHDITGESWPLINKGESHAIRYLEQIDGVLSIAGEKNERLWYVRGKTLNSENRGQIYRANNPVKSSNFDLSNDPHGNIPNTCIQSNNNYNFRGGQRNNKTKVDRNNNGFSDINGPQNGMHQKFYKNDRMRVNGHNFSSPTNTDAFSSPSCTRKTSTGLYNYDFVGDDFFMELAKIDLNCNVTTRGKIYKSGLCISGQTIRDAFERIKRMSNTNNMKIIINLGSVDILHGRDLTDMCEDYRMLIKFCERRNIRVIITTLAPLANRKHLPYDTQKWHQFNEFLIKRFSGKHQVIDIVTCMECRQTGKVLFDCYQANAKYVSGSNQPHLLWNRIGRQRILHEIKRQMHV